MGPPVKKEKPAEELTTAEKIVAFVVKEATFLAKNPQKIIDTRDGAKVDTIKKFEDRQEIGLVTPRKEVTVDEREVMAALAKMETNIRKILRESGFSEAEISNVQKLAIIAAENLADRLTASVEGKPFRYRD